MNSFEIVTGFGQKDFTLELNAALKRMRKSNLRPSDFKFSTCTTPTGQIAYSVLVLFDHGVTESPTLSSDRFDIVFPSTVEREGHTILEEGIPMVEEVNRYTLNEWEKVKDKINSNEAQPNPEP